MIEYIKNKYEELVDWWFYYKENKQRQAFDRAMMYCYVQMYKKSTPSANFKKLMKDAPLNDRGQKVIDFMDYYLPMEETERIIQKTIKKFKLSEYNAKSLRISVLLGCSPTSYNKNGEND